MPEPLRKEIRASEKAVFIYIFWEPNWPLTTETKGYILKLFLRKKKKKKLPFWALVKWF